MDVGGFGITWWLVGVESDLQEMKLESNDAEIGQLARNHRRDKCTLKPENIRS